MTTRKNQTLPPTSFAIGNRAAESPLCCRHHIQWAKLICIGFLIVSSPPISQLHAQENPHQQLEEAFSLEREGHPIHAIATAKSLIDLNALGGADLGRAWDLIGLAYHDEENFLEARRAYEQAIHLLTDAHSNTQEYAAVLANLGDLYRDMEQVQAASVLDIKPFRYMKKVDAMQESLESVAVSLPLNLLRNI